MWPRYTVDLAGMHALYELNYARMTKLLRGAGVHGRVGYISPIEFAWGESVKFGELWLPQPVLQLSRVEQTRYTETWRLAQMTPALPWCPELDMEVRLYNDAEMADVLRFQRARRIPAIVGLADAQGWRVNEKELVNRFLGDCLQHCLAYGHARDPRLLPDFSRWDGLSQPPLAPSEDGK
jgi:uncharacterized protein